MADREVNPMKALGRRGEVMNGMRALWRRPGARGFTLVEMMIAMVLVGILTALIYAMFARTSDALMEVEERSDALDQARFGLDHVRTGLEAAGAQATPNSEIDPWVVMNSGLLIQGVMGYDGWQGQSTSDLGDDDELAELEAANPMSGFSGVVVMGAYDMPASFYVSFPAGREQQADNPVDEMIVEPTERGTARLLGYDPFNVSVINGVNAQDHLGLSDSQLGDLAGDISERVFRVTGTDGISQFMALNGANFSTSGNRGAGRPPDDGFDGLELGLEISDSDLVWSDQNPEGVGFHRAVADDVSFDGALIDAYWYHVRPATDDPRNLQLVRQRVDAGLVAANAGSLSANNLRSYSRGAPMIIAENVVDFRVWFDCATPGMTGGAQLDSVSWHDHWDVVQSDAGTCVTDSATGSNPQRAHFAHVRLSTRTERENANRPHYDLPGSDPGFESQGGQMQTYAIYPEAEGAASVVTVQAGVELSNMTGRLLN